MRTLFPLLLTILATTVASAAKPIATSGPITTKTEGHSKALKADLSGASKLWLVVTDAGDSYACDWADWIEPTLVGKSGSMKLTDLKWKSATASFKSPQLNKNVSGGSLSVNGQNVAFGIGTHANSVIEYDLPKGFDRFECKVGLDDGGTSQGGCGQQASVVFAVYTSKPEVKSVASQSGSSGGKDPEEALDALDVHEGLTASIFAAEPLLLSPSNIDVDHLGRVWVCEVVNYRGFRNKHEMREEGDRILILEDTDADGKADKEITFYQGRDVDSAHGVCVLGNKAIVSAGDSVFVLTDEDGDWKADKKDVLFTGISGTQHDHGIHSFMFGPDGRLYFNFGNAGKQLKDKDGKQIVDARGNVINDSRKPYQEGMVFRCELDGSNVETLGWNFRNNWEVAVDSFGTLWQSDNDDDGNRGVRINFVMEYGNYGYKDELTGAGWRDPRIGMSAEIPERHWHLNDPGVVPNLLQTGAGSPTGIMVYEGSLLPKVFRGEIIHCDAGPNVVRSYPVKPNGAGYDAETVNILEGTRDKWFRPSDVTAAPDGSLIVADWYDPGVGGHAMRDIQRGRLFRIVPKGHDGSYTVPKYDFDSVDGAITALQSPNLAARYLAWTALRKMGAKAEAALVTLAHHENTRLAARAIWLLGRIKGRTADTIHDALHSDDPNIRIVGIRLARQMKVDLQETVEHSIDDDNAAVRRECCIALVELPDDVAVPLWTQLALQYEGNDRWMLESLGIAARGRWDAVMASYLSKADEANSQALRDIVWRSRAKVTPTALAEVLQSKETPADEAARILRAFDFASGEQKVYALMSIAFNTENLPEEQRRLVQTEALARIPSNVIASDEKARKKLDAALDDMKGTQSYIDLVSRMKLQSRYGDLLALAQESPEEQLGVNAITTLLDLQQWDLISKALWNKEQAANTLKALETSQNGKLVGVVFPLVSSRDVDAALRRQAVRTVGTTKNGVERLAKWAQSPQFDSAVKDAVAVAMHNSSDASIRKTAEKLFPQPAGKDDKPVPPLSVLMKMPGDAKNGRLVFHTTGTCNKCHKVGTLGKEVGPDMSFIGDKLAKQALFESILYPSAGISHNYETWSILLEDGNTANGLLVSETAEEISIKGTDSIVRTYKTSEVEEKVKQKISLMPADLQKLMTAQELVDVVNYMQTLKKKK